MDEPSREPLLLDIDAVAGILTVPTQTVDSLRRSHQLPAVKVGAKVRWLPETVREYVKRLEVEKLIG